MTIMEEISLTSTTEMSVFPSNSARILVIPKPFAVKSPEVFITPCRSSA